MTKAEPKSTKVDEIPKSLINRNETKKNTSSYKFSTSFLRQKENEKTEERNKRQKMMYNEKERENFSNWSRNISHSTETPFSGRPMFPDQSAEASPHNFNLQQCNFNVFDTYGSSPSARFSNVSSKDGFADPKNQFRDPINLKTMAPQNIVAPQNTVALQNTVASQNTVAPKNVTENVEKYEINENKRGFAAKNLAEIKALLASASKTLQQSASEINPSPSPGGYASAPDSDDNDIQDTNEVKTDEPKKLNNLPVTSQPDKPAKILEETAKVMTSMDSKDVVQSEKEKADPTPSHHSTTKADWSKRLQELDKKSRMKTYERQKYLYNIAKLKFYEEPGDIKKDHQKLKRYKELNYRRKVYYDVKVCLCELKKREYQEQREKKIISYDSAKEEVVKVDSNVSGLVDDFLENKMKKDKELIEEEESKVSKQSEDDENAPYSPCWSPEEKEKADDTKVPINTEENSKPEFSLDKRLQQMPLSHIETKVISDDRNSKPEISLDKRLQQMQIPHIETKVINDDQNFKSETSLEKRLQQVQIPHLETPVINYESSNTGSMEEEYQKFSESIMTSSPQDDDTDLIPASVNTLSSFIDNVPPVILQQTLNRNKIDNISICSQSEASSSDNESDGKKSIEEVVMEDDVVTVEDDNVSYISSQSNITYQNPNMMMPVYPMNVPPTNFPNNPMVMQNVPPIGSSLLGVVVDVDDDDDEEETGYCIDEHPRLSVEPPRFPSPPSLSNCQEWIDCTEKEGLSEFLDKAQDFGNKDNPTSKARLCNMMQSFFDNWEEPNKNENSEFEVLYTRIQKRQSLVSNLHLKST